MGSVVKSHVKVLNLIITGIPSIPKEVDRGIKRLEVLNLIITGIPSILLSLITSQISTWVSFQPYYNWNTFNTIMKSLGTIGGIRF